MDTAKSKLRAVMLGHAIGDALGVPVEFSGRERLSEDPVVDMRGFGTYPYPAGTWSDDTSMALAALDSLATGRWELCDVMERFGAWYYRDAYTPTGKLFDVGSTSAAAIDRYFRAGKPVTECGLTDEWSCGNGSLMRIHPFSFLAWYHPGIREEWEARIDEASALTHAHGRAQLACRLYTLLLLRLLEAPCRDTVSSALGEAASRYRGHQEGEHFARLFSPALAELPSEAIKSSGYAVDTLEAAVYCLLTTDSYRACVLKAVNLGEDTDTVAAVAGGLAGALYGYAALPREWLRTLKRRRYIEGLCDRVCTAWESNGK